MCRGHLFIKQLTKLKKYPASVSFICYIYKKSNN